MAISGISNKSNLQEWSDRAKGSSYMPDKAQLRHDIGCDGCNQDLAEGLPPMPKQKREEGQALG